jgi:Uma2 family endonuclease
MTIAAPTRFTPDDLLRLPDAVNYELVDGNLMERNMGALSSLVAVRVSARLNQLVETHRLGSVFGADTGYECFGLSRADVRKPDVSFISAARMPIGTIPTGHVPIPPDLAIEVLSPNDLAYDIDRKVEEYLQAGVAEVWVINPETQTVRIHRKGNSLAFLRAGDTLSGSAVVPAFQCPVKDFFPAP